MSRVNIQANYVEEIRIDYAIEDTKDAMQTRKTKLSLARALQYNL